VILQLSKTLGLAIYNRKKEAIDLTKEFCEFDKSCNSKLKKLALLFKKHGNLL
jgi:hypothetical protein